MKVSIIVPIYNVKDYLIQCVESLINQDYQNIEILLIDDGSTDGSSRICDECSRLCGKIRVFHIQNSGVAAARNYGIKMSTGEYLLFVDADDWIEKNCISFLMKHVIENKLDILRFNYIREYENRSIPKINKILEEKVYVGEESADILNKLVGIKERDLAYLENFNFLASCCCNIYKKKVIVENNVFFENILNYGSFEDGLFNIMIHTYIDRFEFVNKYFYHYRKTNISSATSNYRKDYLIRQIKLFDKIKEILVENNKFNEDSFYNRIALSTMEICLNAIRNKKENRSNHYREIKEILSYPTIRSALKRLSIRFMSFKWKVYYFCAKHKFTLSVYLLTIAIQKLKRRG